jgi:hypothetical protein
MDSQVKQALQAAVAGFDTGNDSLSSPLQLDSKSFYNDVVSVFESEADFLDKVRSLDEVSDDHPYFDGIREFLFDLLMINFFASDAQKLNEDYLDSPEWEKIEDQTIDRGTEFLNVLLYLKECKEEDIDPDLDDYLKEFLLIEEDEFQDEHMIYEDIIANELLMDAEVEEIARISKNIDPGSEVKEIFYPFMTFFSGTIYEENEYKEYIRLSENKSADAAVLAALYAYYTGINTFPKTFLNCIN